MVKYVCCRCRYVFDEEEVKVYKGRIKCPGARRRLYTKSIGHTGL